MNKILILFVLILIAVNAGAQEITIIDKLTQQRIPGARIYSLKPKVQHISDVNGRFRLDLFRDCDSIYISYPGYQTEVYTYLYLHDKTIIELSDDNLTLDPLIVTANRWEQELSRVPFHITNLDVRSVEIQGYQTTADLLNGSGSVYVQKSQQAGGSPQLRGFATNRVLISVDGVRMNTAIFRSGNLQNVISIDANSLESAEVLFGPGAVMYGSDAIGGVMDFRTREIRFSNDSLRPLVKTNIYTRYSSVNNERTSHLDFSYGRKKWGAYTSVSYNLFDDLKTGTVGDTLFYRPYYQGGTIEDQQMLVNDDKKIQRGSGYGQYNLMQKIAFKPNEKNTIEYSGIYTRSSDAPRYDRLIQDKDHNDTLDYFDWHYGPQVWMMHRLSLYNTKKFRLHDRLRVNAAYQQFQESRHDLKWGSTTYRHQFEKVDAYSLNADLEKSIGSRYLLFYGAEFVLDKIGSHAYKETIDGVENVINPRYPDQSIWMTSGLYISTEIELNEKFQLNAGARYTYYHIKADFDTSLFVYPVTSMINDNSSLNGSLGFVFNPSNKTRIYMNLSSGFRAPNIDDIGKVFDSQPGSVVVPNTNLSPETAYNAELGFKKLFSDKLMINGAVFYTYLDNALTRADFTYNGQDSIMYDGELSRVQAIQNLSNAYVYGAQGGLELKIAEGFKAYGYVNYQKGYEYHDDSASYFPKTHITPLFGKGGLKYKKSQLYLEFYFEFQGEMKSEDLPLVERDKLFYAKDENGNNYVPSWHTLNFKASYYFNKHLSMNAGVSNITDQLYRTMGSGISAPGRSYMLSFKASF